MSDTEHEFQKHVAGLKIDVEPDPLHREQLRRQVLRAFDATAPQTPPQRGVYIAKLAVAAAIVLGAGAIFYRFTTPKDTIAAELAATRHAVQQKPWMHVVTTRGQEVETHWHDLGADRMFLTTAQSEVLYWDNGPAQKQFVYNPHIRTVTVDHLPRWGFRASGSVLAMLDTMLARRQQDTAAVERSSDTLGGRNVRVYKAEAIRAEGSTSFDRGAADNAATRMVQTFIVDTQTKLLVAGQIDRLDRQGNVITRETFDVDYPQTGPANIYDLGVPASARIIDRTQQPTGTPGDD